MRPYSGGGWKLTVVVGVIYDSGVVMVADRSNLLEEEKYSQIYPKIRCRDNFCAGFAGTSGYEREFMDSISNTDTYVDVFEAIKRKYSAIRWKNAVDSILKPIGCETLEDLNVVGDGEIKSYYLDELKNYDLDLKILLGMYDESPHLCAVGNPGIGGCFDDVGFYAVGTGEKEATITLNFLKFRRDFSEDKAIFFAYLAKKAAEISIGVDGETDIFVIDKNGWRVVDEGIYAKRYSQFIKKLHKWG